MENLAKVLGVVLVGVLTVLFMACLFALPIQLLWNEIMPEIFGLKEISFGQALCLNLLSGFLFKNTSTSKD